MIVESNVGINSKLGATGEEATAMAGGAWKPFSIKESGERVSPVLAGEGALNEPPQ